MNQIFETRRFAASPLRQRLKYWAGFHLWRRQLSRTDEAVFWIGDAGIMCLDGRKPHVICQPFDLNAAAGKLS